MDALPDSFLQGVAEFTPHRHHFDDGPNSCAGGHTWTDPLPQRQGSGARQGNALTALFDTGAVSTPEGKSDAPYAQLEWLMVK